MPGFFDMHRMVCILLREHAPHSGHILVHGAGGGLELGSFAQFNPDWTFLGVDPSAPMLEQAKQRLGPLNKRVTYHHGLIDDAPAGKFDGASSILTLHVLDADSRLKTATEIVKRLKPGAPFIAVHCSYPQNEKSLWADRHQAYTSASGIDPETAKSGRETIETVLPILSPEDDAAILREAGLKNLTQFYAAFIWRGWVGYA